MSKMQDILDRAEQCHRDGMPDDAFNAIIDALKLLSEAQRQTMTELDMVKQTAWDAYSSTLPIGGA